MSHMSCLSAYFANIILAALQPVVVALSGNVLEYMLSLAYVVGGALLGSPAGSEFLAANDAATQVLLQCKGMLCMTSRPCSSCAHLVPSRLGSERSQALHAMQDMPASVA